MIMKKPAYRPGPVCHLPASILKSFQIEFNHQILIACMTIAIAGVVYRSSYVLGMFLYNHYGERYEKSATVRNNLFQCGNPWKPYCRRDFWAGWNDVCIHICDPPAHFMWSVGLTYFTEAPDKKTLCKKWLPIHVFYLY